ncbi:MAG: flavodoxin family protein [Actinobacteria bacterium]|nr:flavodoxin family protein [Actinomycetota bacterium]
MLLDWCLEAAHERGAEVRRFRLCDLDLHGCRGCGACSKDGVCVVKDGMQELYPHLWTADSIVLAAPVYSMGMPAVPKMMVDRCQPFWAWKHVLGRTVSTPDSRQRLGAHLCCAGTDLSDVFDCSRRVVRYLWHVLEVESAGEFLCSGTDEAGAVQRNPSAKEVARDIGRRLAEPRSLPG